MAKIVEKSHWTNMAGEAEKSLRPRGISAEIEKFPPASNPSEPVDSSPMIKLP
jgi:hypothetical protein